MDVGCKHLCMSAFSKIMDHNNYLQFLKIVEYNEIINVPACDRSHYPGVIQQHHSHLDTLNCPVFIPALSHVFAWDKQ